MTEHQPGHVVTLTDMYAEIREMSSEVIRLREAVTPVLDVVADHGERISGLERAPAVRPAHVVTVLTLVVAIAAVIVSATT